MPNLSVVSPTPEFDEWLNELTKSEQKQHEPITFKEDPVAMACASYRAWTTNFVNRWSDLESVVVQDQDRQKASELKAYYRGRMTFQTLRDAVALSAYRKKLAAIVSDTHVYTKQDIGILYRLPYFYQEDQDLDQVMEQTQDSNEHQSPEFEGSLFPLKRVFRSRRAGEYVDFYFASEQSTAPYLLVVKSDNPLISIIEALFKQPSFKVRAYLHTKHPRGYHSNRMFYQLAKLEVL